MLSSTHRFHTPLPPAPHRAADVSFELTTERHAQVDWSQGEVVDSQGVWPDGSVDFVYSRFADHDAVRISGVVDFHVHDERIVCVLHDERHAYLVEIALLGLVFSMWLERRGTLTLHASVATVDGAAVGFLASKGGGKTSTCAACLARGHALLTDDLLAVDVDGRVATARRGFPALRLWPAQAMHFTGTADHPRLRPDTEKVRVPVGDTGFGRFAKGPAPLLRLFVPERHDCSTGPDVELEPLSATDAAMALVQHSFLPREVHAFGWQGARLGRLSALIAAVPVVRLRYRSGVDRLPMVVRHVEEDLRRRPDRQRATSG